MVGVGLGGGAKWGVSVVVGVSVVGGGGGMDGGTGGGINNEGGGGSMEILIFFRQRAFKGEKLKRRLDRVSMCLGEIVKKLILKRRRR